jgi:hypothetical protein
MKILPLSLVFAGIADEHRILYNHLRGHMGIEEKTLAQKAGIKNSFELQLRLFYQQEFLEF